LQSSYAEVAKERDTQKKKGGKEGELSLALSGNNKKSALEFKNPSVKKSKPFLGSLLLRAGRLNGNDGKRGGARSKRKSAVSIEKLFRFATPDLKKSLRSMTLMKGGGVKEKSCVRNHTRWEKKRNGLSPAQQDLTRG